MTAITPPKPTAQRLSVGLRKIVPRTQPLTRAPAALSASPLPQAGDGPSLTQAITSAPAPPGTSLLPQAEVGRVERGDTRGEGLRSARPLPTKLPKKPTAELLRIGWLLADSGQAAAALAIFAEAIAADDRSATAWAAYGLTLAKAGEHAKAADALFKAAMRAPKDIEVQCALGEAALLRGDVAMAHKALAACCALDPKMETPCGLRARALVRKAQKQLTQA